MEEVFENRRQDSRFLLSVMAVSTAVSWPDYLGPPLERDATFLLRASENLAQRGNFRTRIFYLFGTDYCMNLEDGVFWAGMDVAGIKHPLSDVLLARPRPGPAHLIAELLTC